MTNILGFSDRKCNYLHSYLTRDLKSGSEFDFVFSCGDLRPTYLMTIADSVSKLIYYVDGNHHYFDKAMRTKLKKKHPYIKKSIPGCINLHKKVIIDNDFILCGFGGSKRYNKMKSQYTEREMTRAVKKTIRKIKFIQFIDKLKKRPKKKIIVISHAPIKGFGDKEDLPHQGFDCFNLLLTKLKPVLWLYGHIHLKDFTEMCVFHHQETTIVNVFDYKSISIFDKKKTKVTYKLEKQNERT